MKYLFIGFLIVSVAANAQSKETIAKLKTMPLNDNAVLIHTKDSKDSAFIKIAAIIMDYGLDIDNSDNKLFYLNSAPKSLQGWWFKTKLNARIKTENDETIIILKGEAITTNFTFPAENTHIKTDPNYCFAQLYEIAQKYDGSNVTTTKL